MRTWISIAATPSIALATLGAGYALAQPACAARSVAWLHGLFALALIACCALTALGAWPPAGSSAPDAHDRLLRRLALGCGVFFALTLVMQWVAVFLLEPCAT
jgi:hypothetical protein